ncbi:unnamed protein product [Closterium sp. Naga37s-1]|nr:unnamed protein product [Closterium sp. Naga37s-1]
MYIQHSIDTPRRQVDGLLETGAYDGTRSSSDYRDGQEIVTGGGSIARIREGTPLAAGAEKGVPRGVVILVVVFLDMCAAGMAMPLVTSLIKELGMPFPLAPFALPLPFAPSLCSFPLPLPFAPPLCPSPLPLPFAPPLCPSPLPLPLSPCLSPSLLPLPLTPSLCPSHLHLPLSLSHAPSHFPFPLSPPYPTLAPSHCASPLLMSHCPASLPLIMRPPPLPLLAALPEPLRLTLPFSPAPLPLNLRPCSLLLSSGSWTGGERGGGEVGEGDGEI